MKKFKIFYGNNSKKLILFSIGVTGKWTKKNKYLIFLIDFAFWYIDIQIGKFALDYKRKKHLILK